MVRTSAFLLLVTLVGVTTIAQEPPRFDVAPAFDVASVKPSDGAAGDGWAFNGRGGRFTAANVPLVHIIALAYGIPVQAQRFRIVGDNGLLSRRFEIDARMTDGLSSAEISQRVKSLLAERFALRAHSEVRQGPVYALVVARNGVLGPELHPSKHNCADYKALWLKNNTPPSEIVAPRDRRNRPLCIGPVERTPPDRRQISDAGPISRVVESIEGLLDRPLLDATQLSGNFEWQLTFSPTAIPRPDSELPPLSVALREQLGLKLEPRTGPIEVLIVDHVRMPTAN